ncbi:MAG: hypothetical protein LC802_00805 [Acidobacteria bacterium]|nr:hypothetical protein [Acidobacteriota bacterium]
MNLNDLDAGIERGLDFLLRSQLPSGEFKVFMSTDDRLEKDCVVDSSPFPTALIAYSLGFADSVKARAMLDKSLRFFLAEMEGPGLWRYWTKQHPYHSIIPPDLDDIACVSDVLRRHGVSFPANHKLIFANRNPKGLFYTWLTPRWPLPLDIGYWRLVLRQWLNPIRLYYFWKLNESAPDDVDCVVNANVLFYVGEGRATRAVIDYLRDVLRRGEEGCCDKWHLNRFMFYYVVSRNFHAFLLAEQLADGEWPRAALYYGGPKKFYGWGSEELTTGFCLEALLRYRRTSSRDTLSEGKV